MMAFKTKKIGKDKWNGYGGELEEGEDPRVGAARELREESGLVAKPEDLVEAGMVDFHNTTSGGEKFTCRVYVYTVLYSLLSGELRESETMIRPTWFKKNNLPFEEMLAADRFWLPPVLEGKKIKAEAYYGPFQEKLLRPVEIDLV